MSFLDDIELTSDERRRIDELYADSAASLVGMIRASESSARNHLGDGLTDRLLKEFAEHDKGKTEPQGKLGGNY